MLTAVTYRMNLMGSPPAATACSANALLAVASCATVPTMPAETPALAAMAMTVAASVRSRVRAATIRAASAS